MFCYDNAFFRIAYMTHILVQNDIVNICRFDVFGKFFFLLVFQVDFADKHEPEIVKGLHTLIPVLVDIILFFFLR